MYSEQKKFKPTTYVNVLKHIKVADREVVFAEVCSSFEERSLNAEKENAELKAKLEEMILGYESNTLLVLDKLAKAEANILQIHKDLGYELRDPCGTIWEHADKVQKENAELKAKLEEMVLEYDVLTTRCMKAEGERATWRKCLFCDTVYPNEIPVDSRCCPKCGCKKTNIIKEKNS